MKDIPATSAIDWISILLLKKKEIIVVHEKDYRILLLNRSQSITGIRISTTVPLIACRLIGTARGNRLVSGSQRKTALHTGKGLSAVVMSR